MEYKQTALAADLRVTELLVQNYTSVKKSTLLWWMDLDQNFVFTVNS